MNGGAPLSRHQYPSRATDPWARDFKTKLLLRHVGTGLSSKALALYALGLNPSLTDDFGHPAEPRDPADLQRCLTTWREAPFTIRHWMTPVMAFWIDVVSDRYPNPQGTPEQIATYYDDIEAVHEQMQGDS